MISALDSIVGLSNSANFAGNYVKSGFFFHPRILIQESSYHLDLIDLLGLITIKGGCWLRIDFICEGRKIKKLQAKNKNRP